MYSFSVSSQEGGIFPIASRFNHACSPAHVVTYDYDTTIKCLVVYVRAEFIPKGQELTVSYGDEYSPRLLYTRYGFRCQCGACGGLSDEEMKDLEPQW